MFASTELQTAETYSRYLVSYKIDMLYGFPYSTCLYSAHPQSQLSSTLTLTLSLNFKPDNNSISNFGLDCNLKQQEEPFNGLCSGTTRVGRYQMKQSALA